LSLRKRLREGASRARVFKKIVTRSLVLLALGLLLHLFYYVFFGKFRIPGVLQRIALVYFVSACLFLLASHVLAVFPHLIRITVEGGGDRSLQYFIMKGLGPDSLGRENASLLFAFLVVLFWLVPLWLLLRKRIVIKI
jgi:predicted acyltransferase